ncbi:10461_t:CDS:1, partial [Racocetra persica]
NFCNLEPDKESGVKVEENNEGADLENLIYCYLESLKAWISKLKEIENIKSVNR